MYETRNNNNTAILTLNIFQTPFIRHGTGHSFTLLLLKAKYCNNFRKMHGLSMHRAKYSSKQKG